MAPIDPAQPLHEILLAEPAYARVFPQIGIDVRRDAARPFAEACREAGLHAPTAARVLAASFPSPVSAPAAMEIMSLSQICNQLERSHHPALLQELARAEALLLALPKQPAACDSRIDAIREHFAIFRENLVAHLREETETLFPLIRRLETTEIPTPALTNLLKHPLEQMKHEHNEADEGLAALTSLTSNPPGDTCNPAVLAELRDLFQKLEATLQNQIYHENQVLFRRVSAMLSA